MNQDQLSNLISLHNNIRSYNGLSTGFVYVMSSEDRSLPLKIGKSSNPKERLNHHKRSSGLDLSIECLIATDHAYGLERIVLCSIGSHSTGGEWFNSSVRTDTFFQTMLGLESVYLHRDNLYKNSVMAKNLLRQALSIGGVLRRRNGRDIGLPNYLPDIISEMDRDHSSEYADYKMRISESISDLEAQIDDLNKLQSEIKRAIYRRSKSIAELRKASENLSKGIGHLSLL